MFFALVKVFQNTGPEISGPRFPQSLLLTVLIQDGRIQDYTITYDVF